MKRQDGAGGWITSKSLYQKKPFRIGLLAGMTKRRVFEPDLFFSLQWDQIQYERGYQFSSFLKMKGVRVKTLPAKPTDELIHHLNMALREGAII